jgi:hypothetical protein
VNTVYGEPLLSDSRLARIEEQIRKDYPQLPEYCTFVSWVQPTQYATLPSGLEVQIPECAVLAILVTNYRHPDSFRIFRVGDTLERWRAREWFTRHDSDIHMDPAYRALKAQVPEILDWDANLRALLN